MKPTPFRTCVGCFKTFPQRQLIRLVRLPNGMVEIQKTPSEPLPGRGTYLCSNPACLEAALKRKPKNAFQYALKVKVEPSMIETLRKHIETC